VVRTGNRKDGLGVPEGRRPRRPRRWSSPALILVAALLGLIASAGEGARAAGPDKRELNARVDFAAGRYEKALETYAQLYAETLNPIYLRNIGRCDQMMRKPQEAINSFREYLRKGKNLSTDERQEIEGFIHEMEALESSQAPRPATAPAPASTTATAQPPPPATPEPAAAPAAPAAAALDPAGPSAAPAATATASPPPSPPAVTASGGRAGRGQRVAGIALMAGGGALLGTGAVFGWLAHDAATSVANQYDPDRVTAGERDQLIAWVAFSVGAAAVGTGVLLYWHGVRADASAQAAAVRRAPVITASPTLGGRGGTVLLRGEF